MEEVWLPLLGPSSLMGPLHCTVGHGFFFPRFILHYYLRSWIRTMKVLHEVGSSLMIWLHYLRAY